MADTFELARMEPNSFEHMCNLIALSTLGYGHTGFGPGSDGGRDGYFEGEAPYPSVLQHWDGRWYLQAKFHKPHLSADAQKWLLDQIKAELKAFSDPDTKRTWPDNWIIMTNIEPSGVPETGAFDAARALVAKARPQLADRFHIWGGRKILDLLAKHPEIGEYYAHFLTAGNVLSTLFEQIRDSRADLSSVLRFLIVTQFNEQKYSKLDQAGSTADTRPGIHRLFSDLPFRANQYRLDGLVVSYLKIAAAQNHRVDPNLPDTPEWRQWKRHPKRARVWFI